MAAWTKAVASTLTGRTARQAKKHLDHIKANPKLYSDAVRKKATDVYKRTKVERRVGRAVAAMSTAGVATAVTTPRALAAYKAAETKRRNRGQE